MGTALSDNTPSQGLLDTCVIIDMARARDTIGLPHESLISAITLAELSYGIARSTDPVETTNRAQRYARISTWLRPLPFDEKAVGIYGELAALIIKANRNPRPRRLDLMIAATAVSHSLPLYTFNPDDYLGLSPRLTVVG